MDKALVANKKTVESKFFKWMKSKLVLFVAIIGLALIVTAVASSLRQHAEGGQRLESILFNLNVEVNQLNALEWQAMAEESLTSPVATKYQTLRQQMESQFQKLNFNLRGQVELQRVQQSYLAYTKAVDEEFGLLKNGQLRQAQQVDTAEVDPSFHALEIALTKAVAWNSQLTRQKIKAANRGVFAVLVLTIALIFLSFIRFDRERQKILQETIESKDRFRRLVESMPDGVFIWQKGILVFANHAALHIIAADSLETLNHSRLIVTRGKYVENSLKRISQEDGVSRFVKELSRLDGRLISVEITAIPFTYQGLPAIQLLVRDITARHAADKALRESEERYRDLFENANDLIHVCDSEGNFRYVNGAWLETLGYTHDEINQLKLKDVLHPDYLKHCVLMLEEAKKGKIVKQIESAFITKDGRKIDVEGNVTCQLVEGKPVTLRGIFREITTRKQAELALKESEQRFRGILEKIRLVTLILDKQGNLQFANEFLLELTGWQSSEVLGRDWYEVFVAENHREEARIRFENLIARKSSETVYHVEQIQTRTGQQLIIAMNTTLETDVTGEVVGTTCIGEDITERRHAEEKIKYMAYYDELTGLPNRTNFIDRLNAAIKTDAARKKKMAVMFIDLDRFKTINDTLGHLIGDQLLRVVASKLRSCLSENDLVARLGGDEFTILLSDIYSEAAAGEVSKRILQMFEHPLVISEREFHITPSIGITIYPEDGEDAETLLRNADTAMYQAKEQGRNTYRMYNWSMNAKALELMELENSLRYALERKEFVLHYQPQVNSISREIVGVEALIRWEHPFLGMVSPGEFIPLAEETGLIIPIGEWVLRTACEQAKAWLDEGYPPIRMAVNLSARQFQQRDLVKMVKRILADTQLPPQYLELEITESIAMQDLDYTIAMVNELKDLGVHISLDDFGTGYSSLTYLKRFPPIDKLKLDRSFIGDITEDEEHTGNALVATIIELGHKLKLKVVAEGVETDTQLAFLYRHYCDEIQGFLFSRPVPAEQCCLLLQAQTQKVK